MPAGWRRWITAPRWRRSTWRMTRHCADMSGWMNAPRNQGASLTAFELGSHGVAAHHPGRQCRRPLHAGRAGGHGDCGTDRVTPMAMSPTRSALI
jgi:hypothetical protein